MKRVPLSNGESMLVDDKDFEWASKIKWKALKNHGKGSIKTYAAMPGTKSQLAHRLLLDAPKGILVDHIDGDGLNNQRSNLRLCTNSQNHANLGKYPSNVLSYKGIYRNGKYFWANLGCNRKYAKMGPFDTEDDVALAYDVMAVLAFDEFAKTNFLRWCADEV